MTPWVEGARAGDFAAIPTDFGFDSSAELAALIDGDQLTGGFGPCGAICWRVMDRLKTGSPSGATALDLWVALFNIHKRLQQTDDWPTGAELVTLDRITSELRAALLALSPKQKAGILGAMSPAAVEQDLETGSG